MKYPIFGFLYALNLFASEHFIKEECALPSDARELYIDLIKRTVANTIYEDPDYGRSYYDKTCRLGGEGWPLIAHTMIGMKRLNNIHDCLKSILEQNIPGDCIETGVWRGGATILMRAILKAYNDTSRKVYVADSFAGLPPTNSAKYPADIVGDLSHIKFLAVSMDTVQENFDKYGLLDKQVVFVKGLFSETLPNISIERIALLRLDGDYYESTMDALEALYRKVSPGGYVIIDDYCLGPCAQAVSDFRSKYNITEPMSPIDTCGIYWKKGELE